MKKICMSEIFSKDEIKQVERFFKFKNLIGLRKFLNNEPLKSNLKKKGILADYLYYLLISKW